MNERDGEFAIESDRDAMPKRGAAHRSIGPTLCAHKTTIHAQIASAGSDRDQYAGAENTAEGLRDMSLRSMCPHSSPDWRSAMLSRASRVFEPLVATLCTNRTVVTPFDHSGEASPRVCSFRTKLLRRSRARLGMFDESGIIRIATLVSWSIHR